MPELTRLLEAAQRGEAAAPEQLLALVYGELRRIAAAKMAHERPGHTLQATALVHEAWLRLAGGSGVIAPFHGRSHFFVAAGEAMRRILIDHAREKAAAKRGSQFSHEPLEDLEIAAESPSESVLAVDEALDELAKHDPIAADLVKLRYFIGMTMEEAATALALPPRTAERLWTYARAWLRRQITTSGPG